MAHSDTQFLYSNADTGVTLFDSDSVITESESSKAPAPVLSLEQAAAQIEQLAKGGDDKILSNALNAAALKQRIIKGEAGPNVKWTEWMIKNIRISKSHLYALVKIGSADDPRKALEKWRRNNNERSKNRDKKQESTTEEGEPMSVHHKDMIDFILTLPPHVVKAEHIDLWRRYPQFQK